MEKCAQSLSVFPVFALEIWTLRYEPLVSGSSCSLFGCTFLAQCLVRLWIHICVFFGAVFGLVVDMSVAVQRQGFGPTVEKTVGSAVAFLFIMVAVPGLQVVQILGASVEETVVSHSCSLSYVFPDKVVDMPSLCNARCLVFGAVTADFAHLQFINKVWTSLRFCSDVSCIGSCHRFSSSPDMVDIPICVETVVRGCDA